MNTIGRMMNRSHDDQRGFTLIEMMIVVAVLAVLTLIAYPSYIKNVREGRRGQAKVDLVTLADSMERCYTQAVPNSYAACTLGFTSTTINGTSYYTIALTTQTASTYTITSTPVAGSDQAKDVCAALSVNQAGVRTPASSSVGTPCF